MANQDIISTIKDYLHIYEDIDALALLSRLRDEMRKWHPDRAPQGTEENKLYEEKFKELSSLSNKLKKYIEENKKTALVLPEKSDERKLQLATLTDQINDLEKSGEQVQRIKMLSSLNESFKQEIEALKKENSELRRKLDQHNNEMSKEEREELVKLFSVPLKHTIGGWISFFGLLSTFIPQVNTFLTNQLEVAGKLIIFVLWWIVGISILQFLYKKCQRYFLSNAIEYMTDPNNMMLLVEVKKHRDNIYSSGDYVSHCDIQHEVRRYLQRTVVRFFFLFDIHKAVNLVTRNIIAHYLRFGIFKEKKTHEFDTLFTVNKVKDYYN